jgi:hypothetical protein
MLFVKIFFSEYVLILLHNYFPLICSHPFVVVVAAVVVVVVVVCPTKLPRLICVSADLIFESNALTFVSK